MDSNMGFMESGLDQPRQERRELFSRQVRAGRRTYYLDVKENARKDMYLVISEARRNAEGTNERTNVMIFEEDMGNFKDAFDDVTQFIKRARMPSHMQDMHDD